jgi:hypothetical protein
MTYQYTSSQIHQLDGAKYGGNQIVIAQTWSSIAHLHERGLAGTTITD